MSAFDFYGASEVLKPLVFVLLGMVVYAVFVFNFYRFIAKRDIFNLNLNQYNTIEHPLIGKIVSVILYIVEYILLFPIFTFFWFGVLSLLLAFLAEEPVVQSILLFSIALVGAVRIAAYYKENLARDLAKTLPFALLAMYMVDSAYFSLSGTWEFIKQLPAEFNTMLIYLIFIILLEFVLRVISLITSPEPKEGDRVIRIE